MALDCIFNVTGLADSSFHGFFITNFITIVFLILCLVQFRVQLVTACDKLHKLYFSKYFTGVFKKIHCVLQTVIGLYWVASQCRQFYVPKQKSKRKKQGLNQQLIQTVPIVYQDSRPDQFLYLWNHLLYLHLQLPRHRLSNRTA